MTISDSSNVVVRTTTGTGTTMNFDWNGTNDSGAALPVGIYEFDVSATSIGAGAGEGGAMSAPANEPDGEILADSGIDWDHLQALLDLGFTWGELEFLFASAKRSQPTLKNQGFRT